MRSAGSGVRKAPFPLQFLYGLYPGHGGTFHGQFPIPVTHAPIPHSRISRMKSEVSNLKSEIWNLKSQIRNAGIPEFTIYPLMISSMSLNRSVSQRSHSSNSTLSTVVTITPAWRMRDNDVSLSRRAREPTASAHTNTS